MISASRNQGISFPVSPIRDHAFFEQTQFKRLFGDNLLQDPRLAAKVRHLAGRRCTRRVARQPTLAGFEELLRPAVIKPLGDTLPTAQLGNAGLAPQAVQNNADLLFRRILLAGRSPDALHKTLRRRVGRGGFLSHRVSLRVTMSRKSSIPHDTKSVSVALMPDRRHHGPSTKFYRAPSRTATRRCPTDGFLGSSVF